METKALQHNPQHSTCLKTRGVQKPNLPIKPNSTQEHLLHLNRAFGWIWVVRWKHNRISSDVSFRSSKWTQHNQYKPYQYTWHYVIDCIDFPFLLLTCIPYPRPSSLSPPIYLSSSVSLSLSLCLNKGKFWFGDNKDGMSKVEINLERYLLNHPPPPPPPNTHIGLLDKATATAPATTSLVHSQTMMTKTNGYTSVGFSSGLGRHQFPMPLSVN